VGGPGAVGSPSAGIASALDHAARYDDAAINDHSILCNISLVRDGTLAQVIKRYNWMLSLSLDNNA
jgi:hypothetical protein